MSLGIHYRTFGARAIPTYVGEWILSHYAKDGELTADSREKIALFLTRFLPTKGQKDEIKNRLLKMETVQLLDDYHVSVNLKTGEPQPHNPGDLITKLAPVSFDPDARAERWEAFLQEILTQAELIEFVRLAVGNALTGITDEQCLYILHGGGANGKSTFIEVLRALLGDYGASAAADSFMHLK